MKVGENQVFNLMDTNGRRSDVINALQGYLRILDSILNGKGMQWTSLPDSFAQFEFYRQAIELSPEVFKKHDKYDEIMSVAEKYPALRQAVSDCDLNWVRAHYAEYINIFSEFDLGAEDRARHYTSTLVKLGFVDVDRNISEVGRLLLGNGILHKDELEVMLPLNDVNIIYLRQLLKLRIFSSDGMKYYSPFCMAIFALLKRERISQNEFCELVQGLSPYKPILDIERFVEQYQEGRIVEDAVVELPEEIDTVELLRSDTFQKYFKNRKSNSAVDIYYEFYKALYQFYQSKSAEDLEQLLMVYESEKSKLNKAFGYGRNIFTIKRGDRPEPESFWEQEEAFFSGSLNKQIYQRFTHSKAQDKVREYSDTTMRIFKATGLISFENGYVELASRDLCQCIFDKNELKKCIFGNMENGCLKYEDGAKSFYGTVYSISEILAYDSTKIANAIAAIQSEFGGTSIEVIPQIVEARRKREFREFIEKYYPKERVKRLLALFSDRRNDGLIKREVSPDASVPTIYEYMVGLAWYYFSNKRIDLLASFNLTLSANFEPLTHAGGGMGDIVIYEENQVIMLEATLMNANSQKRGEWEPVLRNSVNLKIEEESRGANREVTTFFIADSFDYNTINIWKAVSAVPLQSSVEKDKFTDNVIIMPINNEELSKLMDRGAEYDAVIRQVRSLFIADEMSFDREWREKFVRAVM